MTWQPVEALWPDVETIVPAVLRDLLGARAESFAAGAHVGARRLNGWSGPIVVVRRDGGSVSGVRDVARVSVRVWHDDEGAATDLALLVRSLMLMLPTASPLVTRCLSLSGPYAVQDATAPHRYMLFEVATRPLPLSA